MLLAGAAEPALLLSILALGLLAGSLNLDLIVAMQQESAVRVAPLLAAAALLLVSVSDAGMLRREPMAAEFSGAGLALLEAASALRLLLWFNLIGCVLLPFGIASAGTDIVAWVTGLLCWLARVLLFTASVAVLRTLCGRMRLTRAVGMLGVAMLLGLLAALFLFAGMVAA
jgi:formate hydrogenlyase subunit 4